jgi:hypothetical protein
MSNFLTLLPHSLIAPKQQEVPLINEVHQSLNMSKRSGLLSLQTLEAQKSRENRQDRGAKAEIQKLRWSQKYTPVVLISHTSTEEPMQHSFQ